MLKPDLQKVFNAVHRVEMLTAVRYHLPQYLPFIWQIYRHSSHFFWGSLFAVWVGVQHGDPLGPHLVCLVIRELTKSMQSPLNSWYLDGGTLGCPMDSIERACRL